MNYKNRETKKNYRATLDRVEALEHIRGEMSLEIVRARFFLRVWRIYKINYKDRETKKNYRATLDRVKALEHIRGEMSLEIVRARFFTSLKNI